MDFSKLARTRYSVRGYKSDPVEDEKLTAVLEAARLAPTAANRQPIQMIVVHTAGRKEELSRIYKGEWFTSAPIVICMCTVPDQSWVRWDGRNYVDVDAAIAMDHLILAAADMGLGTCWIAAFDVDAARKVLGIPEGIEPLVFTPLGYPDDAGREKKRKSLDELVRYERY